MVMAESIARDEPAAAPDVPAVVHFPEGMVGCPDWHQFALSPGMDGGPIRVLQSLDEPAVSLLVTDPFLLAPDYAFELTDLDSSALQLIDPGDAHVLCVLTVRPEGPSVTANLMGPVVVNRRTGRARQIILASSPYSVRHPVRLG
jgi:flagellar assembly factor FliW